MTVKTENGQATQNDIVDDISQEAVVMVSEDELELDAAKLQALKRQMEAKQQKSGEEAVQKDEDMPPRIVEKRTRSIDFGIVGSGQAGSRLAECFYDLGYEAIVFNTAQQDLTHINLPESNKCLLEYGLGGASKDPQLGFEAAETHKDKINELVNDKLGDCQVFILCTSLGGGSGSGSVETMIDILSATGRPVLVVTVLPMTNEDPQTKKNSLEALSKLAKEVQTSRINNLIVVDNAKIETIFSDVSPMEFYRVSNKAIVEPIDVFNTFSSEPSNVKSLDPMEWAKIVTDGGGLSLYGWMTIDNYEEDTAIAEAVINNMTSGLLASGFDLKQTKYIGAMFLANKKVWDKIPSSSINYAMAMVQDVAQTPLGVFRGIYVDDTIEEDVIKVYSFFSGLSLPDSRVTELKKEVSTHLEAIKNKDLTRNLALNLDAGTDKTVSQAQKVKDKIAKKSSAFGRLTRNVIDKRKG